MVNETNTITGSKTSRVLSVDIMRGLTLFLMLFVNDLYEPGVPSWLVHTPADYDGMGLADWVFPGFLFMVGISIPFAITSRLSKGKSRQEIFTHILVRTFSLLLIGVLMLNMGSVNSTLTGMNHYWWSILVFVFIFLIWNRYPDLSQHKKLYAGLKLVGVVGLVVMVIIFRSGEPGHIGWLKTGWWGILGLIGWGYFAAGTSFLLVGERFWANTLVFLFFFVLNVLSQVGVLEFLNPVKPLLGILIQGNVPFIVMAGLLTGMLMKKYGTHYRKLLPVIISAGLLSLVMGFVLRNWFIISKIYATPSWGMLCNGISLLVFSALYYFLDVQKKSRWGSIFLPAGQNSLTTYLAPDILYFLVGGLGLHIFFYKQDHSALLAVGGSLLWALAMVGLTALLSKINIRLRL
ncbi:DUF5009 domain-containing protein [Prolixibacter sp. SD074]|uniref:DUF5009 domain-containing protein n=1 Tax=Prolixibacter sp. SD074 TaxID=2652391 RepID=UPI00127C729A|nr:DUF5009 domain-containing protein [Prolixibacter sp. SD074]GET28960.1 hypothetical protein SD074_11620 [Prolixibacter sp. SD074]